jgi:hypothetical protein
MKHGFFILMILLLAVSACNQNLDVGGAGEKLTDAPRPAATAAGRPLAAVEEASEEREIPPFAKAYFMHTWVEALYSTPQNKNPNPNWQSPLVDPVNGRVWCTDCHVSGQVDFTKIPKMRMPMVDELENDREFMLALMKKWVTRLNSDQYFAKAKLKGPVTCLTCHATNPAQEQ